MIEWRNRQDGRGMRRLEDVEVYYVARARRGMMINQGVGKSSETKEPRKCMRVGCMNARKMQEDRVGLGSMGLSRWLVG